MPDREPTPGRSEIDHEIGGGGPRPGAPALWIGSAVAAVIGALLVIAGARVFGPRAPEPEVRRFAIPVPRLAVGMRHSVRLSPDGRHLAYSSGNRLWVRDLERFEPREVGRSEGASSFFWSLDGRRIGYFKDGRLWSASLWGVGAVRICDVPGGLGINNADWGPDGNIVFARYLDGLYVAPARGGEARLLLRKDSTEVDFHDPQFLPDGRHVLAVAHRKIGPRAAVVVSYPEGVRRVLGEFEQLSAIRYSPSGHLLLTFGEDTAEVRVVPFSASTLRITGEPALVLAGALFPSVSSDGTLAYCLGPSRALQDHGAAGDSTNAILLVQHWQRDLKNRRTWR